MAVEARRGCGYRKIGGLYLVSPPGGVACDRLPIALGVCPTCSHGIKQARGFTWVNIEALVGGVHGGCGDDFPCPLCMATGQMKGGLLWIGERFYKTPQAFNQEAEKYGVSRRISAVPRGFEVGEHWILLAHPRTIVCGQCKGSGCSGEQGVPKCEACSGTGLLAGIFKVWRPVALEKILPESARGTEEVAQLEKRGITAVFVPDNDPDHRGSVYDPEEEEDDDDEEQKRPAQGGAAAASFFRPAKFAS